MSVKDSFLGRLLGSSEKFSDEQISQTINLLIEHGVKHQASDIHIEPHGSFVQVRYRIDGMLRGMHKLPIAALAALVSQLKTRAGLNPQDDALPQESNFSDNVNDKEISVRVSTLPVLGGEKVVLHLTIPRDQPDTLEALGFWGTTLREIQLGLTRQSGFTLVTGPKHAGVTQTLHALVGLLNTPYSSVATVEDSIEQRIPGVTQTRVHTKTGVSTEGAMRAVLRQDPNVLMVSSLPDTPSAKLAVHTGATGHIVVAGAFADSAGAGLATLRAMEIEPFLLGSSLTMAIGQRLVRTLCPDCRERYILSDAERKEIERSFGVGTAAARRHVHELESQAVAQGVGDDQRLNTTLVSFTHAWRPREHGCETCNHTGFAGQTTISEVITRTEHVQKALLAASPTANMLTVAAIKDGMLPIALDGLIKALRGQTSIEEVLRALA